MANLLQYPSAADEPVLEREYFVARRPPSGRRSKRRRSHLLPILLALLLFWSGFLLGRVQAAPAAADSGGALLQGNAGAGNGGGVLSQGEPEEDNGSQTVAAAQGDADWNLILINGGNPLPKDFSIPELTQLQNGQAIDSRAYPALQEMMDAARAAGYQPLICSSYRTWDKQEELFSQKVQAYLELGYSQTEAEDEAAAWVARPGTSEHQAGLAVDIVDTEYQLLDETQEDRPVQQWLMAHCAEYGFILRYPSDQSALTGVNYEPWHYRYVGQKAAEEIMDRELCLEAYLNS